MASRQETLTAKVGELKLWGRVAELVKAELSVRQAGKRRGRARGGGQSSKAKGRVGCEYARAAILGAFPKLDPDDVYLKAGSQGGVDLHLSPVAQQSFPFSIEVKRTETLNVWAALAQARANAGKLPPLLFFSRAHSRLYVALDAVEFLRWVSHDPNAEFQEVCPP